MSKVSNQLVSIYSWAAGILDGEGSVMLTSAKQGEFRSPTICVYNTSIELIRPFQKYFGGRVFTKKKYKKHHASCFTWQANRGEALMCLEKLLPYLRHPLKVRRAKYLVSRYAKTVVRNGKYSKQELQIKRTFEKKFFQLS